MNCNIFAVNYGFYLGLAFVILSKLGLSWITTLYMHLKYIQSFFVTGSSESDKVLNIEITTKCIKIMTNEIIF